MAQIPKQDRTHPRTAEDLVRKYNIGKNINEALALSGHANRRVEEINGVVTNINDNMDSISARVSLVEGANEEIKSALELKVDEASLGVYAKTEDVNKAVANLTAELETKITEEEVTTRLGSYATKEELSGEIQTLSAQLETKVTDEEVSAKLGSYATKEELSGEIQTLSAQLETKVTDEEVVAKLGVYAKTEDVESVRQDLRETEESLNNNISAELELKIGKDENDQIVSMLNASADVITMNSNRLRINSDHFKLKEDGTIEATNANLSGTITATEGKFGTWSIGVDEDGRTPAIISDTVTELLSGTDFKVSLSARGVTVWVDGRMYFQYWYNIVGFNPFA